MTHRVGSTEKAERPLGFRAELGLDEGLRSVVEWRRATAPRRWPAPAQRPSHDTHPDHQAVLRPRGAGARCSGRSKPGWVVQGPFVAASSSACSRRSPARRTRSPPSSCTTALHLAVAALGLKPGDEVIVPAFTWVSTANVVEYIGRDAGLLRRRPRHLQHRPRRGSRPLITPRTVGIIPVHLFGLCADMDADPGARRAAHRCGSSRTPPAGSAPGTAAPRRHARRRRLLQLPPAQVDHHRRGRHGHHRRAELARAGRARCATTARRAPTSRGTRAGRGFLLAEYPAPRLQLPDDRHPGRARLRADGPRGVDPRSAAPRVAARYDEAARRARLARRCRRRSPATSTATSPTSACSAPEAPTLANVDGSTRCATT